MEHRGWINEDMAHSPPKPQDESGLLAVPDGTLEALKWLALVSMTVDHINTYLFDRAYAPMYAFGRLAMPIFGFVLAYNLARPGVLSGGAGTRILKRLLIFGLLAAPFEAALLTRPVPGWPLNIMFTLLVATAVIACLGGPKERPGLAAIVFLSGGVFVDYWWFGVAYCVCAWWYCRKNDSRQLALWVLAAAALFVVNGNVWAVAAIPLILLLARVPIALPRLRYAFYAYYPAHLAALLVVQQT